MAAGGAEGATDVSEVDLDGAIDKLKLEGMENNSLKFLKVMMSLLLILLSILHISNPGFDEQNQLSRQFISNGPCETLLSLQPQSLLHFLVVFYNMIMI